MLEACPKRTRRINNYLHPTPPHYHLHAATGPVGPPKGCHIAHMLAQEAGWDLFVYFFELPGQWTVNQRKKLALLVKFWEMAKPDMAAL